MIWGSVQDMNEEERVSRVCVCSAVVLKAIYQDVVIMVRALLYFPCSLQLIIFALRSHFLGHRGSALAGVVCSSPKRSVTLSN